jgi:hypothetical protein
MAEFRRLLEAASREASERVEALARQDRLAAGMASEGFVGGYAAALADASLAARGIKPDDIRGIWEDACEAIQAKRSFERENQP